MTASDRRRLRLSVILIVLVYLALGSLFAVQTPRWQAPDEPAHYNYVRQVAETGRPPVLEQGCWDQAYLERLKSEHFPTSLSIESICYEAHQPPLYYYLAAGPYVAARSLGYDPLYAIRLFSVLLGAGVLLASVAIAQELFPDSWVLPAATAGVVGAVPMHLAILASVNNDVLAEIFLALAVWFMLRILHEPAPTVQQWLLLGIVVGLGLITKTTVYIAVPLLLLTAFWKIRDGVSFGAVARGAGVAVVVILLFTVPWFVRNSLTYGGIDILGLQRHDAVVVGQLRTADWLSERAPAEALEQAGMTTFNSFWGQFGWMAAPLPGNFYMPLWLLTGVALCGLVLYLIAGRRRAAVPHGIALLGLWIVFNVLAYSWYNVSFVQHQGRYLFPSLPALALVFVLGLSEWITPRYRPLVLAGIVAGLWVLGAWSVFYILPGLA